MVMPAIDLGSMMLCASRARRNAADFAHFRLADGNRENHGDQHTRYTSQDHDPLYCGPACSRNGITVTSVREVVTSSESREQAELPHPVLHRPLMGMRQADLPDSESEQVDAERNSVAGDRIAVGLARGSKGG